MYYFISQILSGNQCVDESLIHLSGVQIMKMNVKDCYIKYFHNLIFLDMIFDNDPLICKFISPPKELQSLNCAVFYSGMIESVLISNGFVKKIILSSIPYNF